MNRDYVQTHDVVERYLRGELSDDLARDFEAFYIGCPDTLDELEAAKALMEYANARPAESQSASLWSGWYSRLLPLATGVMGALVTAAIFVFLDRDESNQYASLGRVNIAVLESMRNATPSSVSLDCSAWNVLRVYMGDQHAGRFRATANEALILEVEMEAPDGLGYASVIVPPMSEETSGFRVEVTIASESAQAFSIDCANSEIEE